MCGITGFYGAGTEADLKAMTSELWHRGPDDGGLYWQDRLGFGHRRLAILDIAHGKQPMRDYETGAVLVYNGEIYNHLQIRTELEKLGHRFFTAHSDTETLLRAFLQWGADCLIRFNGMFAFAIYLPQKRQIWLGRDRFGEKPLFYALNEHGFAFASEIAALRLWPGFCAEPDKANIQRFFAWNYLPAGRCATLGCQSLPPGSWLCVNLDGLSTASAPYWQFRLQPDSAWKDEAALAEELRRLIIEATKRRLLSDVPLGVFLSGGIDSSAILAAACRVTDPECLQTFTIGFHEKSFDESAKAASVARFLRVKNRIRHLTESAMRDSIPRTLGKMSEPFGDASLIPTWQLCAFARENVTVALSGDGGDELFGGYDPLAAIRPAAWYRRLIPDWLHLLARSLIAALPASDRNMSPDFRIRRFLRGLSYPASLQLPIWMSGLEPAEIREFFENPLTGEELYADLLHLFQTQPDSDALEQALLF
ncbi:MAG: asparagine synthase (glutamine-hydrolyzing), partial [Desulfovibrio sp.]|nr:asparagine synthase (glutamine-hydrolyzing) [Desulfovibrio sp.]